MLDASKEYWVEIEGWQGYEVSTLGRVRYRYKDGGIREMHIMRDRKGNHVCLKANGRKSTGRIRRLVAEAFLPNPTNEKYVVCKDGDIFNDRLDNLQWGKWQGRILRPRTRKERMITVFHADTGLLYKLFTSYKDVLDEIGISAGYLYKCIQSGRAYNGYIFKRLFLDGNKFYFKAKISK